MERNFCVTTPILIIGFNRPDLLSQVINNIKCYNPQRLYFAIDGPREGNEKDEINVPLVRQIVKDVDFCPYVKYRFNDTNKGCEITESSAISWVLEEEETVIIIEDDIIAHESFFKFAQDMLERYKNDPRIAMVAGCNPTPSSFRNNEDYCFCRSGHIWGWGTWRRAWKNYSLYDEIEDKYMTTDFLKSICVSNSQVKYYRKMLQWMKSNGVGNNTWDYMYAYYRLSNRLLSIVPRSNLTSNIGLYGLHAKGETKSHNMIIDDNFVVTHHPKDVVWNREFDLYHYNKWINYKSLKDQFLGLIAGIKHRIKYISPDL